MDHTIQYCIANVSADARSQYRDCERRVREEQCLQRCGRCNRESFAVVDGVVIQTDHETIIARLTEEKQ